MEHQLRHVDEHKNFCTCTVVAQVPDHSARVIVFAFN